jgi:hypothetical protein
LGNAAISPRLVARNTAGFGSTRCMMISICISPATGHAPTHAGAPRLLPPRPLAARGGSRPSAAADCACAAARAELRMGGHPATHSARWPADDGFRRTGPATREGRDTRGLGAAASPGGRLSRAFPRGSFVRNRLHRSIPRRRRSLAAARGEPDEGQFNDGGRGGVARSLSARIGPGRPVARGGWGERALV